MTVWLNKFEVGDVVYAQSNLYGCDELDLNTKYTISVVLKHVGKDMYLYELAEQPEGHRYHEDRLSTKRVPLYKKLLFKLL